jgi:translation initiation factor 3 subunit E
LYNFGKFQYSYGSYGGAADYLYHFRVLSTDQELNTSAHWGKLASDILTGRWDVALEELNTLRESIDSRTSASLLAAAAAAANASSSSGPTPATADPALVQLHSRTWLVHWSLFVYFNHPEGRTLLLETFLSPTYLNTIQTASPWVLRYLAAAAILSRKASQAVYQPGQTATPISSRVRHAIREVVKVIQMEEYQYTDPVTQFLKELYVEFDFAAAQAALQKAEEVVGNDFFLGDFREEFVDNARYLISEAYCRIHQKIDIGDLAERLNLEKEEGEKWIVNLIRETRMGSDAKIDLEKVRFGSDFRLASYSLHYRTSSRFTARPSLCTRRSSKRRVGSPCAPKPLAPRLLAVPRPRSRRTGSTTRPCSSRLRRRRRRYSRRRP